MIAAEVEIAKERSGWPVRRTLLALGIAPATYYRQQGRTAGGRRARPVVVAEALPEERAAVEAFARRHPELRHRALAWTMVDQDVACLSPSTVYRILRRGGLVPEWAPPQRRRSKPLPRPSRPNAQWQTDLRYVKVGELTYYLLVFLDIYSRCIVHHELLRRMDGRTVALAAQAALEQLPERARMGICIQSDNGSAFVSGEFARVLAVHGVGHHRIWPHTPEQNAFVERVIRTVGEPLHEEELASFAEAQHAIAEIITWYNHDRLHSALGYLTPVTVHAGLASHVQEQRRQKLAAARAHRRAVNLGRRQLPLPLNVTPTSQKGPSTVNTALSHFA